MNIAIKPSDVKKHTKITKIEQYFEQSKETKTASFHEVTLTHIPSNTSVSDSGYNEMDIMINCLEKLNKIIIAREFFDNISSDNITEEINEIKTVVK